MKSVKPLNESNLSNNHTNNHQILLKEWIFIAIVKKIRYK